MRRTDHTVSIRLYLYVNQGLTTSSELDRSYWSADVEPSYVRNPAPGDPQ
jgi:hypothetical protein